VIVAEKLQGRSIAGGPEPAASIGRGSGSRVPEESLQQTPQHEMSQNRAVISAEIMTLILKEGGIDPAKLTPDATIETLGLVSIDLVMALLTVEEKFGVYVSLDGELQESKNLQEFVDAVAGRVVRQRGNP
jgi:acyl carrier protein